MAQFGSITNAQRFRLLEIQREQRTLAENKAKAQEYAQLAEDYAKSAADYYNELAEKVTNENRTQIEDKIDLAAKAKDDAVEAANSANSAALSGNVTTAEACANIAKEKLSTIQKYNQQVEFLLNEENNYGITEEQWAILSGEELNEEDYDIVEQDENGIKSKVYKDNTGNLIKTEYYDESGNISKSVYYFESEDNKHLEITKNANEIITEAKEYTDEQNIKTTYYNTDGSIKYIVEKSQTEEQQIKTVITIGTETFSYIGTDPEIEVTNDFIIITSDNLSKHYSLDGSLKKTIDTSNAGYNVTTIPNGDTYTKTYTDNNNCNFTEAQWSYLNQNGISLNYAENNLVYEKSIQSSITEDVESEKETSENRIVSVKQEGDFIVITETDDNGAKSTYIDVDGNVAKIVVVTDENETTTVSNEDGTKTKTIVSNNGNQKQIIQYNTEEEPEFTTIIKINGDNITEIVKDASGKIMYTKITTTDDFGTSERVYDENNNITILTYKDLKGNTTKEVLYNHGENRNQTLEVIYENGEPATGTVTDNNTKEIVETIDYKKERQIENVNDFINQFKNGEIKKISDLLTKFQELGLTEDDYTYTQEDGVLTLTINIGTPSIEYTNDSVKTAKELYIEYANNNAQSWEEFCESIEELEGIYDINNYSDDNSDSGIAFISFYFNGENYNFNKKIEIAKEEDIPGDTGSNVQSGDGQGGDNNFCRIL